MSRSLILRESSKPFHLHFLVCPQFCTTFRLQRHPSLMQSPMSWQSACFLKITLLCGKWRHLAVCGEADNKGKGKIKRTFGPKDRGNLVGDSCSCTTHVRFRGLLEECGGLESGALGRVGSCDFFASSKSRDQPVNFLSFIHDS